MAFIQRFFAILFFFFVIEVTSEDLSFYYQIKHITQHTFKHHDVKNINLLDFRGCEVEHISYIAFDGMTSLQTLVLKYNYIKDLPVNVFNKLVNIKWIDIKSNKLNNISKILFLNLREMTRLNLGNNLISSLEAGTFDTNNKLSAIFLDNNRLTDIPNGLFSMLKELEFLDLSDNFIDEIEQSALPNFQNLKTLKLHSNRLRLFEAISVNSLTSLTLDKNPWYCDCRLQSIHAVWNRVTVYPDWTPVCYGPNNLQNRRWDALNFYDLCKEIVLSENSSLSLDCYIEGNISVSEVKWTYENNTEVINVLHDVGRSFNIQSTYIWKHKLMSSLWYNLTIYDITSSDDGIYKCVGKHENYTCAIVEVAKINLTEESDELNLDFDDSYIYDDN